MKIMRISRFMMIGLVATSLLASCKKEDNTGNNNSNLNLDGISFKASTEKGDPNAKTYLDYDKIKWMSGDQILVQNNDNQQAAFEVVEGIDSQDGVFYTGSTSFDRSPNYAAVYPYDKASISGTTATFTIPQQQSITTTGTFGNGTMPMVAYSSNNVLHFYNVFGGICFPIYGPGKHVTKIVLTSKNSDDKLWGSFAADCTSDDPTPVYVPGSGGGNSIELICNGDAGINLTNEPQEFFIMVPPGTMTAGFSMSVYDGPNCLLELPVSWDAASHADFIKRSHVSEVDHSITFPNMTVMTVSPSQITTTQAYGQGQVTVSGGETIRERGICWAKATDTQMPTLDNNVLVIGNLVIDNGTERHGGIFNGLEEATEYYVRAYAKNASGAVKYGDPIPFATLRSAFNTPYVGTLPYPFSVGSTSTSKVYFSMGNLQYKSNTNYAQDPRPYNVTNCTWKFADKQYDYIGASGNNVAMNGNSSSGWLDLFGWATSGWNHNGLEYYPWATGYYMGNYYYTSFYAYGNSTSNLGTGNAEWGHNPISNGGNSYDQWRTLTGPTDTGTTGGEWDYLFNRRSGYRYAEVQLLLNGNISNTISNVNGYPVVQARTVNGLLVFPDNFTWPEGFNEIITNGAANYASNMVSEALWTELELKGVMFLPAAGVRLGTSVMQAGNEGGYWASTIRNNSALNLPAWGNWFGNNTVNNGTGFSNFTSEWDRYWGISVRLVHR